MNITARNTIAILRGRLIDAVVDAMPEIVAAIAIEVDAEVAARVRELQQPTNSTKQEVIDDLHLTRCRDGDKA